jgi:HTH-type transcriptional regulator / antitoxin HigA
MELINTFPPRSIANEAELDATQDRINSLLDKGNLTQDDHDYLKVLGMLVFDYEEKYEQMPTLRGGALLKALMEEANLQPLDLVPILGSELSSVEELLTQKQQLTKSQIQKLAVFFNFPLTSF